MSIKGRVETVDPLVPCHLTLAPPEGWCTMMRALGSECLMPVDPAARSRLPMLAAWPTHQVEMGLRIYCMVS